MPKHTATKDKKPSVCKTPYLCRAIMDSPSGRALVEELSADLEKAKEFYRHGGNSETERVNQTFREVKERLAFPPRDHEGNAPEAHVGRPWPTSVVVIPPGVSPEADLWGQTAQGVMYLVADRLAHEENTDGTSLRFLTGLSRRPRRERPTLGDFAAAKERGILWVTDIYQGRGKPYRAARKVILEQLRKADEPPAAGLPRRLLAAETWVATHQEVGGDITVWEILGRYQPELRQVWEKFIDLVIGSMVAVEEIRASKEPGCSDWLTVAVGDREDGHPGGQTRIPEGEAGDMELTLSQAVTHLRVNFKLAGASGADEEATWHLPYLCKAAHRTPDPRDDRYLPTHKKGNNRWVWVADLVKWAGDRVERDEARVARALPPAQRARLQKSLTDGLRAQGGKR